MNETILTYLTTVNFLILGLLYLLSRKIEKTKLDLDEYAAYLYDIQEKLNKGEDGDDSRTGN